MKARETDRPALLAMLETPKGAWDVIVIGGGATGLGVAVDAAARGYRTLLLEQHDFAKGTSSRSTKLVHGGVRYLKQGNVSLVLEALHERGLLMFNAPHLIRHQAFVVPSYGWWEGPFYGIGMKVYDKLAGKLGLEPSQRLSLKETRRRIPTLEPDGLRGGVVYYDDQFDDARLAVNLAQTVVDHGGVPLNYMAVTALLKKGAAVSGVAARDEETGRMYEIPGRVVVNATGVFADGVIRMDDPTVPHLIAPSQGVHLIVGREFLPGRSAVMVPHTDDGRVLFAVPWHGAVILGTTDTPIERAELEPRVLEEEIDFILKHSRRYLARGPERKDVLSMFAGIRPLFRTGDDRSTAAMSRDHTLLVSPSGLVTITGGKWTTYRRMAQDTVDLAITVGGLERRPCPTEQMPIHGWVEVSDDADPLHAYGADVPGIRALIAGSPGLGKRLHRALPYLRAEVVWGVRREMARTVEDVLARRTRALFLNARASIDVAKDTAALMAAELGRDEAWQAEQVARYEALAAGYLPSLEGGPI